MLIIEWVELDLVWKKNLYFYILNFNKNEKFKNTQTQKNEMPPINLISCLKISLVRCNHNK